MIVIDEFILNLFFLCVPFVDCMTGFLIKNGIMSEGGIATPSQLFKFILYFLFFIRYLRFSKKENISKFILLIIGFVIYEFILSIILNTSLYALLYGILNVFKISYLFLFYFYINCLLRNNKISIDKIIELFILNGVVCVFLIIITTLLHLNYSTYGDGTVGTKGLFPSGNGISLYIGAISFLSVINFKNNRNMKNLLISFFLIIGSTIIGTKASIIFLLINIYYFSFRVLKKGKLFIISILIFLIIRFLPLLLKIFDVIIFRYKNSKSLFAFFASGRDNYIKGAFEEYYTNGLYSLRIFWGMGAFLSFRIPSNNLIVDTLENDFFDIFFMYGINGLCIYIIIIIFFVYNCIKKRQFDIFVLGGTIFFYSLWAGHMVFNATSGVLLPLVFLLSKNFRRLVII